ncbi:MAG: UDP-N-acetylmuramate dehydrogenase [Acidimicrobiales bacterium]|nr:UDP-N-acetylmuramate dehydrogenase [Acidimicrobiales bacterium]
MSRTTADPGRVARAVGELEGLALVDEPLGPRTTYRVGGAAAVLVEAGGDDDLRRVRAARRASGLPTLVLGRGSNVLVADAGFPGIVVLLGPAFADVVVSGDQVRAGGAVSLPVLARRTVAAGLTGLEWAVGVPGSVGGAVRMNAGGHGSDLRATLLRVRVVDLAGDEDGEVSVDQLGLGYRSSALRDDQVVVWAEFALARGSVAAGEAELAEIVRWRREHQPGGQNAGSVFANPPGDAAGRLIDAAGLRGLRWGSAQVSEKHANFIQADEGGSADDVRTLILEVQDRVARQFGVRLQPELRLVGFEPVTEEPV